MCVSMFFNNTKNIILLGYKNHTLGIPQLSQNKLLLLIGIYTYLYTLA